MKEFDRITFDSGLMGRWACIRGMRITVSMVLNLATPSVILFRTRKQTPQVVTPRLLRVIQGAGSHLAEGSFVTAEDHGYRVRVLPIP